LHPRANAWDMNETNILDVLHEVFSFANEHTLPVLIHTGYDAIDEANKFSRFFGEYTNAKIILAHCRPIDQTLDLLKKYNHIFCDTAFVPKCDILKIIGHGFSKKMLLGSDFPITHYYQQNKTEKRIALADQYKQDKNILDEYKGLIEKDGGEDDNG
jgi:predicted TIM-barrel fold metal-dependent hydrolase